jgi:hypothetical protein
MLIVAATAAPASAQVKIDTKLMQVYGGVLAPDCSNYMLPQLKYLGDSLVVQDGGKAVLTGRSEIARGETLVFVFYRNASGLFAAVEGGPKVMAALPAAGNSAKIFKGYALTELSAAGLLYNARAKEIYYKALGPLVNEPWLAKLDGPSSEGQAMKVADADYVMLYTCKNHDCYDHNVVLLWSGIQNVVYGKINQKGKSTLIGNPPPAVAAELEKIWKKQFRSQAK